MFRVLNSKGQGSNGAFSLVEIGNSCKIDISIIGDAFPYGKLLPSLPKLTDLGKRSSSFGLY
jgi:hypothetical protein